jgi:hypothetical protein
MDPGRIVCGPGTIPRVDCRITVHPKGRRRVTHIRKLLMRLIRLTAAAAIVATLAACTPSPEPQHLSASEFTTAASSPSQPPR